MIILDMHNLDKRLSHLDEKELFLLINQYYNTSTPIKKIMETLNIKDMAANDLYKNLPTRITENKCPDCDSCLYIENQSRSFKSLSNSKKELLKCSNPNCRYSTRILLSDFIETKSNSRKTKFDDKKASLELELLYKEKQIFDYYSKVNNTIKPKILNQINFTYKIFLGVLLSAIKENEDVRTIPGNKFLLENMMHSKELRDYFLGKLYSNDYLLIDPTSSVTSFDMTSPEFPSYYYVFKVNYLLNIENIENVKEQLLNPKFEYCEDIAESLYILWKFIAVDDVVGYLKFCIQKLNYSSIEITENINSMFHNLIEHFSISQIHYIIYNSINRTLRYAQESNISSEEHIKNLIIYNIKKYAGEILLNDWDVKKLKRNSNYPKSIFAEFLFNKVLEIGEEGYNCVPEVL